MSIVQRIARVLLMWAVLGGMVACTSPGQRPEPPQVGAAAPPLALPLLDGGTIQLADQQGRVVIVNFWASWCVPCVSETPRLVGWFERYREDGLQILGVNFLQRDSRAAVEAFVKDYNVTYPVPVDEEGAVAAQWLAQQLPRSYVVDRQGIVRFVRIGELTDADFEREVLPLLRETS